VGLHASAFHHDPEFVKLDDRRRIPVARHSGPPCAALALHASGKSVATFDRTWLALVLTCQVSAGAILGIAAQFALAVGVIFYVLPWMGLELLDTARAVAKFDLPMRVLGL
jgi:hypothetical protein